MAGLSTDDQPIDDQQQQQQQQQQLQLQSKKSKIQRKLAKVDRKLLRQIGNPSSLTTATTATATATHIGTTTLGTLLQAADDRVTLAFEYLNLVRIYPTTMRTIIFHIRRMLKSELTTYQLMEECLACADVNAVEWILIKIRTYRDNPASFQYDVKKAQQEKEALERKRLEEGKRKAYEARMIRKAKREGKEDLEFYLRQGATVPTKATVEELQGLDQQARLQIWKDRNHSQHCLAFHLGDCKRGRSCAFMHVDCQSKNCFEERNEVAG